MNGRDRLRPHRQLALLWLAWICSLACAEDFVPPNPFAEPDETEEPDTDRPDGVPPDSVLEELGATIGGIHVQVDNIFDTSKPEEDKGFYRVANRLHIKTKDHVIVSLLVFESGDTYSVQKIEESERILRNKKYLHDATIRPISYDEETNTVDIGIHTRDLWTLAPEIILRRSGGITEWGIGLNDSNLFGTGKALTVAYRSLIDRDEAFVEYLDPNVRGKRTQLGLLASDNSDGYTLGASLERPFYALDTRWSAGGRVFDDDRIEPMWDLGEVIDQFRQRTTLFSTQGGLSRGLVDKRVRRWLAGYSYERMVFAPVPGIPPKLLPEDLTFSYPWIGFQLVEDDFRTTTNLDQMGRTEDVAIGGNFFAQLGYSSEALGGMDALIARATARKGWQPDEERLLFFSATGSTRYQQDEVRNLIINTRAKYYHRNFGAKHLFFAALGGTWTQNLDAQNQVLLGGDTGLRGYPVRYQSGTARGLLTLEQRLFSNWYPLNIFHIGGAVFVDVGRTWGEDPRGSVSLGWLRDVGIGLRLGSTRTSAGAVIHIDLAFPLDGDPTIDSYQIVIRSKASF